MKSGKPNLAKELYARLRTHTCEQLWNEEIPLFDRANAKDRFASIALIRAVGVVFSETGTPQQKESIRIWLRGLLRDPEEKVRRYAMTALPKIGGTTADEKELLTLLESTNAEREIKFLGRTLDKIGGKATLEALQRGTGRGLVQTELKVRASVARVQGPSEIKMDRHLTGAPEMRIHLRCRTGLEEIVRDEIAAQGAFTISEVRSGLVSITSKAPFRLSDLYALRCFGSAGFVLGQVYDDGRTDSIDALAKLLTSPLAQHLFRTFTEGPLRYRIEFTERGHQRGAVRELANRAYALCPEILNDARLAPWTVAIHPIQRGYLVELEPRLRPDPRYTYRLGDVPAASHPPLAACMARLAGPMEDEVVWDPFCGSGLELIERTLLGGVKKIIATDQSPEAIDIAKTNFGAANTKKTEAHFHCCTLHEARGLKDLGTNSITLLITNPPMGMRVPVPNLRELIADLFAAAAATLKPGGRLVFPNPVKVGSTEPSLKLESRTVVDLGGFECRLELYRKTG